MSSLMNTAMTGINAARVALNTVGNNVTNYNVTGYTRQTTVLAQANSTLGAGGWEGNGVYVTGVRREYDAFISYQLRDAQNQSSGLDARYQQMAKIDGMFSSSAGSLSSAMQGFFGSLQILVSNAEDPAARQELIGKAESLVSQFKVSDHYLRDQNKQINTAIVTSVEQINNYTRQIAGLNSRLSGLTGVGTSVSPNDLLDQRDQLVNELNKIIAIEVSIQDGDIYNITMGNGFTLVQGFVSHQLAVTPSAADPGRARVAYLDGAAGNTEIPEKLLNTGSLGGLITFRSQDLDSIRNKLGQLALAFVDAFNTQHEAGFDARGNGGGAFFAIGGPSVFGSINNLSAATLRVQVADSSAVQATDYAVVFDGTDWQVTRLADSASFMATRDAATGNLMFDGLEVSVMGTPQARDSFTVSPVSNAIIDMQLLIRDVSDIALAAEVDSGASDNRNGQLLLNLQSSKQVEGNKSFNDAWAALVSDVGNRTAMLKISSDAQNKVVAQLNTQQQSLSGVNLDKEYADLMRYQQYYLASAQVLRTATMLFDTLLNIR